MDLLSQHEAFLRAIYDAPDDDTPRLVYADFLQEQGDEDRAELIRVQCELSTCGAELDAVRRAVLMEREGRLSARVVPSAESAFVHGCSVSRGFWHEDARGGIEISVEGLSDVVAFRWRVVRTFPAWYGERALSVRPGSRLLPEHVSALCSLPFVQQVTDWNLGGTLDERPPECMTDPATHVPEFSVLLDYRPVMTNGAVDALARHRGASRILSLDLRNNDLDNDAARALVRSPYLDHLKRLQLLERNRLRGKVWQQVIERFGEDVVG